MWEIAQIGFDVGSAPNRKLSTRDQLSTSTQ